MKRIHLFIFVILLIPLMGSSQSIFTLSGIITDSLNGKTLENIDIVVENKLTGTISSSNGTYILYLDKGSYQVRFSAPGYKKNQITVNLTDDRVQMVELSPKIVLSRNLKQNKNRFALRFNKNQELLSDNQTTLK